MPTIIEMVTMTRLDCVLGSAGGLRAALSEATHHAAHRVAFGRELIDQPAMTAVLADLAVESWAATLTALRLGRGGRRGQGGDRRARPRCCGSRCRWPSSGCANAPCRHR